MINERNRQYRRFGLTGREITLNINEPPPNTNAYELVEQAMSDMYELILRDYREDDFIGVEIFSPNLGSGSVWFSFRLVRDFNVNDL